MNAEIRGVADKQIAQDNAISEMGRRRSAEGAHCSALRQGSPMRHGPSILFIVTDPAKRRATYEDVLRAPPHRVAEVVRGTLYTHPRPKARHARAMSRLGNRLGGPFDEGRDGPGGWILLDEPELHLGSEPDIVVPDIAGWRRERMPELPLDDAYLTLAPDWICEVLSNSTESYDRAEKMDVYAAVGVAYAWLLDAEHHTLEIYRLESGKWLRLGAWRDDAVVRAEPFDAIELPLGVLWEA